jgi:zinc protease
MISKIKHFSTICIVTSFLACLSTPAFAEAKTKLAIQSWTTANGASVYFVPANQLPIVDVAVGFAAGSSHDSSHPGLANFTNDMLQQGAQSGGKLLTADQIDDAFANTGALFSGSASQDAALLTFRSLTKPDVLNPSLKLFSDIINHPTFPANTFAREKSIAISSIQASNQDPMIIAQHTLLKTLYPNYPYGNPVMGTLGGVQHLTRNNLVNFYHQYYVASNATVAIVGDVTRQQAEAIANTVVGQLPKGQPAAAPLLTPKPVKTKTIHINYPAAQTTVLLGQMGIKRDDPDYFPLLLANYSLGGGLVSELFSVVREQYGLSYDIRSSYLALQRKGPFIISLQTQNKNAEQAIQLTNQIAANFAKNGPTVAELAAAKRYVTDSYPLRMTSNGDIENTLIMIGLNHLPLNYMDTYVDKINAVTLADVQKALHAHLLPQDFITVTVGGIDLNNKQTNTPIKLSALNQNAKG